MPWTAGLLDALQVDGEYLGLDTSEIREMQARVEASRGPIPVIREDERARKRNYVIEDGDDTPLGVVTLTRMPRALTGPHGCESWELDVMVYPDHRGQGIAASAVAQIADQEPSVELVSRVYEDSPFRNAVVRVLVNAGFVLNGLDEHTSKRLQRVFVRSARS